MFELLGTIVTNNTVYNYPAIAPDNSMYAVAASDVSSGGEISNVRIEVRDMRSRDVISSYDISEFNGREVYLDDWIINPPLE